MGHIQQILEVNEGLVKSRVEKELIDEREGRKVIAFGQRHTTEEEEQEAVDLFNFNFNLFNLNLKLVRERFSHV